MLNYISFLFKTLRKKKSVYIISVISFLLVGVMIFSQIKFNRGSTSHLVSISSFEKFFPFVLASLFSAMIITHIFKDGEKDGTELMIVAKPITRKEIIMGKFIVIVLTILIYQTLQLVGYLSMTTFDKIASSSVKFKWAFSLAVGGVIVQLIISSVIILISSFTSKIGTVVLTVLISSFVPIVSFIVVPLAKGRRNISHDTNNQSFITFASEGNNTATIKSEEIYNVLDDPKRFKSDYLDKRWYEKFAPVDIWYQWGRFYSIFTNKSDNILKFDFKNKTFTKGPGIELKVIDENNKKEKSFFALSYDFNYRDNNGKMIVRTAEEVLKALQKKKLDDIFDKAVIANINGEGKLSERLKIIRETMKNGIGARDMELITHRQLDKLPIFVYQYLNAKQSFNTPEYDQGEVQKIVGWNIKFLKDTNTGSYFITSKPFISTSMVITLWFVLGLMLMSGAIAIYAKRDFK